MALGVYVRLRVRCAGGGAGGRLPGSGAVRAGTARLRERAPGSDAALRAEPRRPARLQRGSFARGCRARCVGAERRSDRPAAGPSPRAAAAPRARGGAGRGAVRGSPRGAAKGGALPGAGLRLRAGVAGPLT